MDKKAGPPSTIVKSPLDNIKDNELFFCCLPWTMAYSCEKGWYSACNWAKSPKPSINVKTTSIEEWMTSNEMNNLRTEMLTPGSDLKVVKDVCERCVFSEKNYGSSRRTNINSRYQEDEKLWSQIKNATKLFKITGMYDFEGRMLEVQLKIFGSQCNLDCFMCHHFSSSTRQEMAFEKDVWNEKVWGNKIEREYTSKLANLPKHEDMIDQIVALAPYIRVIKIIGGEPLIMKKHYEMLDKIIESGHAKQIAIKYQTNLTQTKAGKHNFFNYIPHFKRVSVVVSVDGISKVNDYIRRRSKFKEIENNIKYLKKYDNVNIDLNGTLTFISVLRFYEVIDYFKNHKEFRDLNWWLISKPSLTKVNNLPQKLKDKLIPVYEKYEEAYDIVNALKMDPNPDSNVKEVLQYLLDTDKAYKGTKWEMNLFDVFPELKEYYGT
jgi:sulfatase maturation enzyme AslB (radical SAM superfamily)